MSTRNNSQKNATKSQRRSFTVLFSTEMWERFAFYTLSSLFVLYLIRQMGFSDGKAFSLYGAFTALLFIMPPVGGYLADRYLNYQSTLIVGVVILIIGYSLIIFPENRFFYMGLSCIIIGQGFFKSMPYLLLGQVYGDDKKSLDSRYTLYYLSINIGGIPAVLFSGVIAKSLGWDYAYAIAALGMVVAFISFSAFFRYLKPYVNKTNKIRLQAVAWILLGSIAVAATVDTLLLHVRLADAAIIIACLGLIAYVLKNMYKLTHKERKKLWFMLGLIALSIVFFAFWYQMPTSLTLFIARNVDRHIFGFNLPASSFWAFNPIWILVMSPILAWFYKKLGKRNPNMWIKFSFGLGLIAIAYWVIVAGCRFFNTAGIISAYWIVAGYLFLSLGELLVSALGASMVIKYSPQSMRGVMMGVWFFASSIAGILAGRLAKMTDIPHSNHNVIYSLHVYQHAFSVFGTTALIITLGCLLGYGVSQKRKAYLHKTSPLISDAH